MKKILAMLLALCMVFSMVPVLAMAAENEALVGTGFEFDETTNPAVAEDWEFSHANSKIENGALFLNDDGGAYDVKATYATNKAFNLSNGFTLDYTAKLKSSNNLKNTNRTYCAASVGNILALVRFSNADGYYLIIKVNGTEVATSALNGWGGSTFSTYFYSYASFNLDYDTETKTITYSVVANNKTTAKVTYVDEANAVDVSNSTVYFLSNGTWDVYAHYGSAKLEGKAPSLKDIYVTTVGIDVDGFNTTDWTPSKEGVIADASNALNAGSSDRDTVKATSNGTYTIGDEFEMSFTYAVGDHNNYYGDGVITFGTNKIGVGNLGDDDAGVFHAYVKTSAGIVAKAHVGTKDKTAIGGVYVFSYKDGMLSGTVDGVALNWDVADGTATEIAVTFDVATDVNFVGSITGNYGPGKYIKNFSWYEAGTTYSLHEINEAMGTLADASLETYAEAAATIDTVMPLLSQENKDLLTNLAVYEKYKADYTKYTADKEADAEIVAKNVTYTLINGMYAEDWKDVTGGGAFYRGNTVFGEVTAKGDGFYASGGNVRYSMTSVNPLATANNYFKIVQKSTQSEYSDTNFKWTIGDLTIGIYVDGNNPSNSYGDTGYNDGKAMAIFQIFYKGELVKVITGQANNYGFDTSVDPCSTWMLANCEFTITYDNGNLMITYYNGVTKYITPKTGLDLNTLIDGFNYNPNGNHVKLDIFTSYSQLSFNKLTITGKANKAAVDNLAALAQTNPGAAKLIYDSISDKSIVDDATAAILNGEFAISAAGPYDVVIGDGNYNSKAYRYGDTVTFTAVDNDCFIFTGWYDGEGNLISEDPVYTCDIVPHESLVGTIDEINSKKHCDTHIEIENNVDPECETEGSYDNVVYCDYCGEELSRETITVDTLGHTAGETVIENKVDAICTVDGSYDEVVYCTVCGKEISRNTVVIEAVGEHIVGGYVNNGDGTQTKSCPCGEVSETVTNAVGADITWTLEDGVLTLTGTGATFDYVNVGNVNPFIALRKDIKEIVIGDGITHLGNRLFRGVTQVEKVTFGADVETTGYEVFYACLKLKTVVFNEGFKELGSWTFYNCKNLVDAKLPSTLTTINNRAFKLCIGLTEIVIPDSVTYVGYEVFMGDTALESVTYTNSGAMINSLVFKDCTALTEFTVPANVNRIRTSAFANSGLLSITFVDERNLTSSSNGDARITSNAFEGCSDELVMKGFENGYIEYYSTSYGKNFKFEATDVMGLYLSWAGDYEEFVDYNPKARDIVCTLTDSIALHVTGDGVNVNVASGLYDGGDNGSTVGLLAENNATVVIDGGTFKSNGNRATVVIKSGASVTINGGFFAVDSGSNVISNEGGTLVITGGTFVNYDPTAFVAEGYAVTAEEQANGDVWYTVE